MIETVKKILNKLIDNIEEYKVSCSNSKHIDSSDGSYDIYNINWIYNNKHYYWIITPFSVRAVITCTTHNYIGCETNHEISEDNRYELLNLCVKLQSKCKSFVDSDFENFANLENDDLEQYD